MKRKWKPIVILLMAAMLLLLCLQEGRSVQQFANKMSAKYKDGGLSARQIDKLNSEAGEANNPYVTGWNKKEAVRIRNEITGSESTLNVLEVYGNMAEVIPDTKINGSFAGTADTWGCVISITAAEQLFRSREVIGCALTYGAKTYLIRGIINTMDAILMVPCESSKQGEVFPYLELRFGEKDCAASNTKALLTNMGLPDYAGFMEGNLYAGIAGLFMGLPFVSILLSGSRKVYQKRLFGRFGIALLVLIGAVLLVIILQHSFVFSDDYIPSRLSDFSFWFRILERIKKDYDMLLQYQTWPQESVLFAHLKRCMAAGVGSCALILLSEKPQKLSPNSKVFSKLTDNYYEQ